MNIEMLTSTVDAAIKAERESAHIRALQDQAIDLDICPSCGNKLHKVSGVFAYVFLSMEKKKCSQCGTICTRHFDTCC